MPGSMMNAQVNTLLPLEVSNWIGRQLFEYVPSNIVIIDRSFKIVLANRNFQEVFGDPDQKYCYEVYKNRSTVCENCMAARTFTDGKVRVTDEEGCDRKGRPAHYIVHLAPVYNEVGEVTYVIEMSYDVTENKSLQREYNILFERVPCYVAVINRSLRIVRANELLRKTFGDTTGRPCYEVLKHRNEQCTKCPAKKTFTDGKIYTSEQEGVTRDGKKAIYLASTAPLSRSGGDFSHVIEMSIDITDTRELSNTLASESSFRHLLTENSPDALVAIDADEVITIFNPAAEKLFEISAREVIGMASGALFLPEPFIHTMRSNQNSLSLSETSITTMKGTTVPVRFNGMVVRNDGTVLGGVAYLQDLRAIKELEHQNIENERLAAVGQTVAQLAHGIKNILTGLQGGLYIIRSGIQSSSNQRTMKGWNMLDRNVLRITTLVKGFLNYAKGTTLKISAVNPTAIVKEVYELYSEAAHQKGIELVMEAEDKIHKAHLSADGIHTCLANLVSNALDACESSQKEGCIVTLRLFERDEVLFFEVVDTGCGIEPEVKAKVFNTFFTTKGLAGNGLGLLVTKKIVREHGGDITLETTLNKGSLFRITLPRKRLPTP